jgi:hypothetical protein
MEASGVSSEAIDTGPEETTGILGRAEILMRTMHKKNVCSESSSKTTAESESCKQARGKVNDRRF